MVLKEHELLQIDERFIRRLLEKNPDALAELSIRLSNDLKEALERLNQNPSNSSKPSSSLAPWDKGSDDDDELTLDEQETHLSQQSTRNSHRMSRQIRPPKIPAMNAVFNWRKAHRNNASLVVSQALKALVVLKY